MTILTRLGQITPKNVTLGVIMTNMVCRPTITLSNKSIPEETRKYTATREFCTEFFGLATTYTFATFVEKSLPKFVAKKFFNTDLTKELVEKIGKTGWESLTTLEKNLKGVMTGSSLLGTALAVAVLTPLINNIVLNKLLGKIMNKKDPAKPSQTSVAASTVPVELTPGFKNFLEQYSQGKVLNKTA